MASLTVTPSESWDHQKKNVKRIFAKFQQKNPTLRESCAAWEELPEKVLCDQVVYDRFANYLAKEYLSDDSDPASFLTSQSAVNYLSSIINDASAKFKVAGDADVKLFFTCLDTKATTEQSRWLKTLKKAI